jgi:hypothetical protein
LINLRENQMGNQEWTFQRNWQHWVHKTQDEDKEKKPINVGHHYTQTNRNNVNKTCVLLQTTGGKDEPNIVFMRTS